MKKIILIIILLGLLISCREKNYCIKNQEFFRRVQDYCNCKCQFEYNLQRFNKDKSDKVLCHNECISYHCTDEMNFIEFKKK